MYCTIRPSRPVTHTLQASDYNEPLWLQLKAAQRKLSVTGPTPGLLGPVSTVIHHVSYRRQLRLAHQSALTGIRDPQLEDTWNIHEM